MEENKDNFPLKLEFFNVDSKIDQMDFDADLAHRMGVFNDQVLIDAPSVETEDMKIKKDSLADIKEISKDRLAEKIND